MVSLHSFTHSERGHLAHLKIIIRSSGGLDHITTDQNHSRYKTNKGWGPISFSLLYSNRRSAVSLSRAAHVPEVRCVRFGKHSGNHYRKLIMRQIVFEQRDILYLLNNYHLSKIIDMFLKKRTSPEWSFC